MTSKLLKSFWWKTGAWNKSSKISKVVKDIFIVKYIPLANIISRATDEMQDMIGRYVDL